MTKAFDLALFVGTPVNPGDGVVVNTIGPPLNTKFAPMVSAPVSGVVVGASVPAATAPGQSLISGAGPSFGWGVGIPSGGGGGITDAPSDGTAYARKNLGWAQITHGDIQDWSGATAGFSYTLPTASTSVLGGVKVDGSTITISGGVISSSGGSGGGISDAPNDGTSYARKSLGWSHITHADITDWASALSGYALTTSVPGASSTAPAMDGTAAAGAGVTWSRGDHVHPTDTSRYAATNPSGYQTAAQVTAALPVVTTTTPAMDGVAAIGASGKWADGAHVHPVDTSRYAATNPSGYQTAAQVTAALPVASSTTPVMDGTAAVGTGTTWARADHVHPVDTSRYAATNPSGYQTAAQVSSAITAAAYTLPTASTSVLGGVKVDGTTVTIASGVISAAGGGGGGISDAPNDGTSYARKSAAWAHLTHSDLTDWATATASFSYTLPNATTTVLGGVKVDGTTITAASGVISAVQPTVPGPSGTTPVMDGTATAGSSALYSRGDHVHPTDTTRAAVSALPVVATTVPLIDGTATIGASGKWADGAHIHPTDTTRYAASNPSGYQTAANVTASLAPYALIASPTFTGVVTIPTGAAIATPNITGVVTVSNAAAGQVGEWVTAQQLTNVALTNATAANITSISLTAGDWDVDGIIYMLCSTANLGNVNASVSLTSATLGAPGTPARAQINIVVTGNSVCMPTGRLRVNVSTTTTVYLVAQASFGGGTCNGQGTIQARRMR